MIHIIKEMYPLGNLTWCGRDNSISIEEDRKRMMEGYFDKCISNNIFVFQEDYEEYKNNNNLCKECIEKFKIGEKNKMKKCPKEECVHWNIEKEECENRYHESSDGYGPFLRGFLCKLDEGLENEFKKRIVKFKYDIGDEVYYCDDYNFDRYEKFEDSIIKTNITEKDENDGSYFVKTINRYDCGSETEETLFDTKKECHDHFLEKWKKHIKQKQKYIKDKIKKLEEELK